MSCCDEASRIETGTADKSVGVRLRICGDCENEYPLEGHHLACRLVTLRNGRPAWPKFVKILVDPLGQCPEGKW